MKRSSVLSLFAVALTALCATTAQAVVDVQLNLRYTNPAALSAGGTWELLVKSSDPNGVAQLNVSFIGIPSYMNNLLPIGTGRPEDPDNVPIDDLFPNDLFPILQPIPDWNNSTLLETGSFVARPIMGLVTAVEHSGGVTIGRQNVRGDSLRDSGLEVPNGAGLFLGDSNRDGDVSPIDLGEVVGNWFTPGNLGWDDGDFDNSGGVGPVDLGAVVGNWFFVFSIPPAISAVSAVPEPSSLVLLAVAALGLAFRRRK